jgi:arylsulfatase
MSGRPNIILLMTDQHRADVLGVAGNTTVATPNLDLMASRGFAFRHAYCQGPLCVPARASLLTERYVRHHGATDNDYPADFELPTVPQAMAAAGYETAAIGKMHFYPHTPDIREGKQLMHSLGFDEVYEEVGKAASAKVETDYSDYLRARGTLDLHRDFVRARTARAKAAASKGFADGPLPPWTVEPSPLPVDDYLDNYIGRRIVTWLQTRRSEQPFFLWAGFAGPHAPWDAPTPYVDRYRASDISLDGDSTRRPEVPDSGPLATYLRTFLGLSASETLSDERIRTVRRHYYAGVSLIDDCIGQILAQLDASGLADNTWVVYTSDHGEMLGTHGLLNKEVFYEPAVRIPLIMQPPGGTTGRVIDSLVEHVDLSATLRDIASAPTIPSSAGQSLLPALSDGGAHRDVVVSENFGFGMWRTATHKLVVYEKESMPVQLFDLTRDPLEDHNVVDDPRYAGVVDDLMTRYVKPFLSTPARCGEPDLVERGGVVPHGKT